MYFLNADYQSSDHLDLAKFMEYKEDAECYDVLPSYFFNQLMKLKVYGTYTVTHEVLAPDLIAKTIWGNENLYALLLMYNKINSVEEIVSGKVLVYPNFSDVERLFLQLKIKDL